MPTRPCLNCGALTTNSTRCQTCEAQRQQARNARRTHYHGNWAATSRATIAAHIANVGHWCPGWGTQPHPATDLTTDHHHDGTLSVLCRSCNSRKGQAHPVYPTHP